MKNASAIERCIEEYENGCAVLPSKWGEAARAELAGYTEIGPCGKHLKMFLSTEHRPICDTMTGCEGEHECLLCREIEQAVEREVAGMREACADVADSLARKVAPSSSTVDIVIRSTGEPWGQRIASEIRSLDSSAAQHGKQAIERAARIAGDQAALKDVVRLLRNCANDHDADCSPAGAVALRTMAEAIETEPREYDGNGNAK